MKNISAVYPRTILVSRTDSLGDVVLTLPLCIWLKRRYPKSRLLFLGQNYTKELIQLVPEIDEVLVWPDIQSWNEAQQLRFIQERQIDLAIHVFPNKDIAKLLKKAQIPYRIGTANRWYHWLTCNVRPQFSRKKSSLNEAQLNFELVRPLGLEAIPTLAQLNELCDHIIVPNIALPDTIEAALQHPCIILHPKSQGNGAEWPIKNYIELAQQLLNKDYHVIFTGRESESHFFRPYLPTHPNLYDSSGQLSLAQLLSLIKRATLLVASGTGPLHIAGLFNIYTVGLFPENGGIGANRWHPLGNHSRVIIEENTNTHHKKSERYLEKITTAQVLNLIQQLLKT